MQYFNIVILKVLALPTRQHKTLNSISMILLGSFDSEIEISHHAYYMLHQHFSSQI